MLRAHTHKHTKNGFPIFFLCLKFAFCNFLVVIINPSHPIPSFFLFFYFLFHIYISLSPKYVCHKKSRVVQRQISEGYRPVMFVFQKKKEKKRKKKFTSFPDEGWTCSFFPLVSSSCFWWFLQKGFQRSIILVLIQSAFALPPPILTKKGIELFEQSITMAWWVGITRKEIIFSWFSPIVYEVDVSRM